MGTTQQQPAQQAQGAAQQPAAQKAAAIVALPKNISDNVLQRVAELEQAGELTLPTGYTAGNAIKLAWLNLQEVKDRNGKPALEVCSQASICNCLLEMVIKGLSVAKKQCYFIVTGNQLTFWEDYRGKLMRAKRDTEIANVTAQVVYKGDDFKYTVDEFGQYQLVSHETKLENINLANILGAYAVVVRKDGTRWLEIMTLEQIKKSWQQGAARGNSGAHNNFTDQMCKKTVISRACKIALGAAVEEADEPDTAAMQREAAQQPQNVDYVDVSEQAAVVDVETGELVSQQPEPLQPADTAATQPEATAPAGSTTGNLFNEPAAPATGAARKCPL
ncbi:MAG: recombinase RecT [Ruminococcus flavefaciens]|nr:recombinase RecT [Ruminococcus flavefaciens]